MFPRSYSYESISTSPDLLASPLLWFQSRHVVVQALILILLGNLFWAALKQTLRLALRTPGFIANDILLSKFEINAADPTNLVHMIGRSAGFWGWMGSVFGLGKQYEMHVSERFVMVVAPGVFDGMHAVIPTDRIVTAAKAYYRPIWPLLLAGSLALYLRSIPPVALLTSALIVYVFYWRRRAIRLAVSAGEGFWGFRYLIGSAGSFEKAAETLNIVRNLLTAGRSGAHAPVLPVPMAGPEVIGPLGPPAGVSQAYLALSPATSMGVGSQALPAYPPDGYAPGRSPGGT